MANVILKYGNVLDAKTDAILLTIDGELVVASEKQNDRRYGNIANAFARKWPGILESERWYPLWYGDVYAIEPDEDECGFRLVVLASVLPHPHSDQSLNIGLLHRAVRRAVQGMVQEVSETDLSSCAMGLIKCGWRMNAQEALQITMEAIKAPVARNPDVTVLIYFNEANEYETLTSYAASLEIVV